MNHGWPVQQLDALNRNTELHNNLPYQATLTIDMENKEEILGRTCDILSKKLITHLHPVPRLRMCGVVFPLVHTSS
jgi:hypothetical protein